MTQDNNKDAALELAKEFGFEVKKSPRLGAIISFDEDGFVECYNAARKQLEEENANILAANKDAINWFGAARDDIKQLKQQLLATQEAYQRVVEALEPFTEDNSRGQLDNAPCHKGITTADKCGRCGKGIKAAKALSNPPSLEAVERKKLEDELEVLTHYSIRSDADALYTMIAERKAKLERLK